jgi:hypothetical protein
MTLPIVKSLNDVEESLREHYVKRGDGQFEPEVEGYTSLSGLLAKKEELQGKVRNHSAEVRRIQTEHERELAEQKEESDRKIRDAETKLATQKAEHETQVEELKKQVRVPDDQVAIPKADAELLTKYKELGEPDSLTEMKTKHDELSAKEAAAQKLASLEKIGKIAKIPNTKAFAKLANQFDLKTEVVQVAQGAGKDPIDQVNVIEADGTKRLLSLEYLKENDEFAVFADSLEKTTEDEGAHGNRNGSRDRKHVRQSSGDNGNGAKDTAIFSEIRDKHKDKTTQSVDTRSPAERLGRKS